MRLFIKLSEFRAVQGRISCGGMAKRKDTKIFLSLFLLVLPFFSASELKAEVFPVPVKELEQVVTRWFQQSGFVIVKTASEIGTPQLRATKGETSCLMTLKPRSALASEVEVTCVEKALPESSCKKLLADFIASYLSGDEGHQNEKACASQPELPVSVLSKIETVACIRAVRDDRNIQFSGFFVDGDGLLLSTAHDIEHIRSISVILHDGQKMPGTLVKVDPMRDLALIDIEGKYPDFVSFTTSRNLLGMGEKIFSVGCPINLGGTVYPGIVNGPPRLVNGQPLWQVNMEIHHGSSGSPVFDLEGNLVAVVKGRMRGTESIGFLIPIETIVEFSQNTTQ